MRQRFMKGERVEARSSGQGKLGGKAAPGRVVLGLDFGMSWTKLAEYEPTSEGRPKPALFSDPNWGVWMGSEQLKGAVCTIEPQSKCRAFKPWIGRRERCPHPWQHLAPEEVLRHFVEFVLASWQRRGDVEVIRVGLTCPVRFPILGRIALVEEVNRAVKEAKRARSDVVSLLLPEPVAVTLAQQELSELAPGVERLCVVYDLGGATFDCALVRVRGMEGSRSSYEVLAIGGLSECGGEYFDREVMSRMGIPEEDRVRIKDAFERWKIEVSRSLSAEIAGGLTGQELRKKEEAVTGDLGRVHITAAQFRELLEPEVEATIAPMNTMLSQAGRAWEDVNLLILNGGGSQLWFVKEVLERELPGLRIKQAEDPIRDVAYGAALAAGREDLSVIIPLPEDLWLETPMAGGGADVSPVRLFSANETPEPEGRKVEASWLGVDSATIRVLSSSGDQRRPLMLFSVALQGAAKPGETAEFRFTIDGKVAASLYGALAVPGALLPAVEVSGPSGRRFPVTASREASQLSDSHSAGWALGRVAPCFDIGVVMDASGSSRHKNVPIQFLEALRNECEQLRSSDLKPKVTVSVVFYGDERFGETPVVYKRSVLLGALAGECPPYVGGDACETQLRALERLLEMWQGGSDQWTARVVFLVCDSDDGDIGGDAWDDSEQRLQQLSRLIAETGCHLFVVGTPGRFLAEWTGSFPKPQDRTLYSLGLEGRVIPHGSQAWYRLVINAVLVDAHRNLAQAR